MLHFFYFLVFYLLIFLVGRSLTALCYRYILDKNFKDSQKAFNLPIYYFYTLFGLFFIGNISVINNFFFKNNIFYLKVIFLLLVLFNLTERIQIRINLLNTLNFLLIPIIISMSTLTIGLAYDAGLYQPGGGHQESSRLAAAGQEPNPELRSWSMGPGGHRRL